MEFHGIPWNSTVFHGFPRRSMEFHGILWNSTAFYGIPWHSMEFHGILWNSTALYRMPRNSMEFHGILWNSIPYQVPLLFFFHFSIDCMESDGKLVPILHGIPSNGFHRIPYDSTADLQTGSLFNACILHHQQTQASLFNACAKRGGNGTVCKATIPVYSACRCNNVTNM
ncbi:hypothetical protein DPMN_002829 [Dreissena polymorpha]|uniref:Uncharacterized protein n=1 Tax=Dreissena polymorpha TaxID=45954 RepID=A0A9D4MKT3_DREPO|nr:hypothetical protein DPMN_002829 [Dreissena polymorpha]